MHLTILEAIRDVCKRVVKELTSWVSFLVTIFIPAVAFLGRSLTIVLFLCFSSQLVVHVKSLGVNDLTMNSSPCALIFPAVLIYI